MPDVLQLVPQDQSIILEWYRWGVIVSFFLTLVVMIYIFVDAARAEQEATLWKSIVAVASVLSIPALLARLHAGFANNMRGDPLIIVAVLSMLAVLLAVVAAIGHGTAGVVAGREPRRSPDGDEAGRRASGEEETEFLPDEE